uniref:Putative odorant-binding protein n=1 Tax=Triatoma brasiliensis TaxID=65344 RepID=A0A162X6J2_TRIBS|nr:putative odorant-binding protein [Triatoma brasiliensis]
MFLYTLFFVTHIVYMTNAVIDVGKLTTKSEVLETEKKTMEDCLNKAGLKYTMLKDHLNGQTPEATKELKCVLGCYTEELGYVKDKKTQWHVIEMVHQIEYKTEENLEKGSQILKNCKTIVPEVAVDTCDAGYALYTCYMKQAIKVDLHP